MRTLSVVNIKSFSYVIVMQLWSFSLFNLNFTLRWQNSLCYERALFGCLLIQIIFVCLFVCIDTFTRRQCVSLSKYLWKAVNSLKKIATTILNVLVLAHLLQAMSAVARLVLRELLHQKCPVSLIGNSKDFNSFLMIHDSKTSQKMIEELRWENNLLFFSLFLSLKKNPAEIGFLFKEKRTWFFDTSNGIGLY